MPNSPVEVTRPITVLAVGLTLSVNVAWQKVGSQVVFSGRLSQDGSGWAGQTIYIILSHMGLPTVVSTTTDGLGNYSATWTVPFTVYDPQFHQNILLPCSTWHFYAYHMPTNISSSEKNLAVAYNSRIRDFSAPASVPASNTFVVEGYLEYEISASTWTGLGGKTVSLFYDSTKITDVTTGTDGKFSQPVQLPTPGSYVLKASFAGQGLPLGIAPSMAFLNLADLGLVPIITIGVPILIGIASILQVR